MTLIVRWREMVTDLVGEFEGRSGSQQSIDDLRVSARRRTVQRCATQLCMYRQITEVSLAYFS